MPDADADTQVVRHPLAQDEPVGVVDLERERVGGLQAAERDTALDLAEEWLAHRRFLLTGWVIGRRLDPR